jgi:GNAT superfamily N-acetyltransferase
MTWMFPSARVRRAHLEQFLHIFLALAFKQGVVYTTPGHQGAAIWFMPNQWRADVLTQVRWLLLMLRVMGPRRLGPRIRAMNALDRFHPSTPNYYLMVLGTAPEAQGRGIGSALMAPILARADAEGMPAYLETATPGNVPFYEHRGFRVQREVQVPDGGPQMWLMWRDPAPR